MSLADSLIHPTQANEALLRASEGYWSILRAPRWLTSALGLEADFPLSVSPDDRGHPLRFLAALAEEMRQHGHELENVGIPLTAANGDLLNVLVIRGTRSPEDGVYKLELRDITQYLRQLRAAAAVGAFHSLVGQSLPMLQVYDRIQTYGPTEAAVLVTGETGTGKELVARALHDRSRRAEKPYVAVNCNALTADLFESELFGHEKGSFTGAIRQHRGRFERADGGTLFLDEIGDMPLFTQAKMLRALEEGIIERIGSEKEQRVDVRIISATNVPLQQAVQQRTFRADLFHRLSVLRIHVPPLRERHGDLPLLVNHFLQIFNQRYGKAVRRLTPEALRILEEYHWPGNVRELRNVMERLVIESQGEVIGGRSLAAWVTERDYLMPGGWGPDDYPPRRGPIIAPGEAMVPAAPRPQPPAPPPQLLWSDAPLVAGPPVVEAVAWPVEQGRHDAQPGTEPADPVELTEDAIRDVYTRARGNLTRAAAMLGVHKATLYRHLKRLGLSRESLEEMEAGDADS